MMKPITIIVNLLRKSEESIMLTPKFTNLFQHNTYAIIALLLWILLYPLPILAGDPPIFDQVENMVIDESNSFFAKTEEGESLKFLVVDKGVVMLIEDRKKKYKHARLSIPGKVSWKGEDYTVKYIGNFAIGSIVGKADKIEEIVVPETVEYVGQGCFAYMKSLKIVTLPKSLRNISYGMFEKCPQLSEVYIPYDAELREIDSFAFMDCKNLRFFHIPQRVETIVSAPWRNCTGLKEINVASSNANFESFNGVLYTKGKKILLQYPTGKEDQTYEIPQETDFIGNSAFYGNSYLQKIVFGENVAHVSHIGFRDCVNLSEVYLPNSLAFIGNGAFWGCTKLNKVVINRNTSYTIEDDPTDSYNSFMPSTFVDRVDVVQRPQRERVILGELKVDNMTVNPMDITASKFRRFDNNGSPCALIIVALPIEGCKFSGNVIGATEYHTNEYWVYLSENSRFLKIQAPGIPTMMLDFNKYGFTSGVESLSTYYLTFCQ